MRIIYPLVRIPHCFCQKRASKNAKIRSQPLWSKPDWSRCFYRAPLNSSHQLAWAECQGKAWQILRWPGRDCSRLTPGRSAAALAQTLRHPALLAWRSVFSATRAQRFRDFDHQAFFKRCQMLLFWLGSNVRNITFSGILIGYWRKLLWFGYCWFFW